MTYQAWPSLAVSNAWKDTWATLHMWLQIVGKIRLCVHAMGQSTTDGTARFT